jgi:galactokinase
VTETAIAFAPGRVNLIGEHTDYNQGLALPFAIEEGVTVKAVASADDQIWVNACDLDAHDSFALSDPGHVRGWRAFARGAVAELGDNGARLIGAKLEITGSVARGSGLSSSAALELAVCLALLGISGSPVPDRVELARLCSRIENDWVGANTGLLDQLASLFGARHQAICIDFRSLEMTPVALALGDYSLVTVDSGQRHANAGRDQAEDGGEEEPGYNQRRRECEEACERLGVDSLRDVTLAMADGLPSPLDDRARHVICENERVRQTVEALDGGDLPRVGELLNASHASLRDRFDVSTPAVEATVSRLRDAGAIGARIMGGGFGGNVLGLMAPGARTPDDAIEVRPGPGAGIIG